MCSFLACHFFKGVTVRSYRRNAQIRKVMLEKTLSETYKNHIFLSIFRVHLYFPIVWTQLIQYFSFFFWDLFSYILYTIFFPYRSVLHPTSSRITWESAKLPGQTGALPVTSGRSSWVCTPCDCNSRKPHDQRRGDSLGRSHPHATLKEKRKQIGETPVEISKTGLWLKT